MQSQHLPLGDLMVKKPQRDVPPGNPISHFRDAKKPTITPLSQGDLDRINTPVQHSATLPNKMPLKDVERCRENEIRLRYELDLAKQLAADNFREAESAKALINDHLMNKPSSQKAQRSPMEVVDDSHINRITFANSRRMICRLAHPVVLPPPKTFKLQTGL